MANQPIYLDPALTGVANAWFNQESDFVANKLMPTVTVKKPTFKVAQYGKENLYIPSNSLRTGDAKTKSVNFTRQLGLLHDQVTVLVTRPDWPVWS